MTHNHRQNGRYTYSKMETLCVCGHTLGYHGTGGGSGKRVCLHGTEEGETQCSCENFKKASKATKVP